VTVDRAALIIRGLSGSHLAGFLPGNDNKQAIASAASGQHSWSGPGIDSGAVTRKGIGLYPNATGTRLVAPPPLVLITWPEVLSIVAAGCGDGRREAYEAAFAEFMSWARDDHDYPLGGTPPPADRERYFRVTDGLHVATAAVITTGCQRVAVFRADQIDPIHLNTAK
jgi:hypothetical protein